jgi:hypothetical protein
MHARFGEGPMEKDCERSTSPAAYSTPHGSNTIRTSAIAIVVGGLAKVIATALAGSAGG